MLSNLVLDGFDQALEQRGHRFVRYADMGTQFPGLQLHERNGAAAAYCVQGAIARFKVRVRDLTHRKRGVSIESMVKDLSIHLRGWLSHFGFCQTTSMLRDLESWLRRQLRAVPRKQWNRGHTRFTGLRKRAVGAELAAKTAESAHGPWHFANSRALAVALPNAYFASLGFPPSVIR